jgi:CHASE2 domain-containing sensor protein
MNNIESHDYAARRFQAEQAVALMDRKMRIKLGWHAKDGLIKAMTKGAIDNGLLFGHQPFHPPPRRWSLEGMLSRLAVYWKAQRLVLAARGRPNLPNGTEVPDLSEATFSVKRSGARGLVIVLILALLVGLTGFGAPFETGVQIGRDALRRTAVSGDIVVVGLDEASGKQFGQWPWPRRHDAALIDKLRAMGAKRIVYNVIFAEPSNPVDDAVLLAAFDRAKGLVWLGAQRADSTNPAMSKSVLPAPMFRDRVQLAHYNIKYGLFGQVENIPGNISISGVLYQSQADALAETEARFDALKLDYAIDHRSVTTISAVDVINGKANQSLITGKTVFVAVTSEAAAKTSQIIGYGRVPFAYSWLIAAETIKNGVATRLGFWIPLAIVALLGLWCIMQRSLLWRLPILIGGVVLLTGLVLGGDRLGYHFEIVPAGLAWLLFGVRQCLRGEVVAMTTLHPVSKLPRLGHLAMVRDCKQSTAVAVRILNHIELMEMGNRPEFEQYQLDRSIAARINVIAPDCIIHQGEEGLFVFLIAPDSVCNPDHVGEQIRALFCMQLVSLRELMNVEVAVGINTNIEQDLTVRVAVAVDRARPIQFTGLHAV